MKKHFLKFMVTQGKYMAICATGFILFSCGNSQSGMKMGDDEYAVATVTTTSSNQTKSTQQQSKEHRISKSVRRFPVLLSNFV